MKINGIDWRVYFVEKDNEKLQRSDGSYTLGSCDNNTNIIYKKQENCVNFLLITLGFLHVVSFIIVYIYRKPN